MRDVYFSGVFQSYRFFDVILVAFALAAVSFSVLVAWTEPKQFRLIATHWKETLLANLGTACAWMSFFYALKLLEPSIVNTIHAGTGPITLIVLNALGLHLTSKVQVRPLEIVFLAGILAALIGLGAISLLGLSGVQQGTTFQNILGLTLAVASGIFISVTTDVTKRMHGQGISASGVLAVRFFAIIAVAAAMSPFGASEGRSVFASGALAEVAGAAAILIVLPVYLLQLGIKRISAVSTWVLMATGPSLVFAVQLLDGRIAVSGYTLVFVALYTVCAIAGSLVRRYETG